MIYTIDWFNHQPDNVDVYGESHQVPSVATDAQPQVYSDRLRFNPG